MALAPLLFHEKLTWTKTTGFIAVLLGMLCVNTQALNEGKTVWGLFCGFMSACLYAVMVIFNKKAHSISGLENAMGQLTAAFLIVAVFFVFKQGFAFRMEPGNWIPVLILGVINTGIGCYFYFSSIGKLPVQTVAVCGYVEPLSAVVFSMLFLHERMTGYQVIGAVLILGGAAFSELMPKGGKSKAIPTV
jgi:drug/metabolite transporter (DMT)-like permease